jgi:hypothetical protein
MPRSWFVEALDPHALVDLGPLVDLDALGQPPPLPRIVEPLKPRQRP